MKHGIREKAVRHGTSRLGWVRTNWVGGWVGLAALGAKHLGESWVAGSTPSM